MFVITAGHTGPGSGAQGVAVAPDSLFDEGAETLWLRDEVASILSGRFLHSVLIDDVSVSLPVLKGQIDAVASERDFLVDIHFNAHPDSSACGCESVVAVDANADELRLASRLAHSTAAVLEIPLRGVKCESDTPHRRLGILHLRPNAVILEVCFATSPSDVRAYYACRHQLARVLAYQLHLLSLGL